MRLSFVALALSGISAVLASAEEAPESGDLPSVRFYQHGESAEEDNMSPHEKVLTKLHLTYVLEGNESAEPEELVEFLYSKPISIIHTLVNNEERELTVVGVGGRFLDPSNGKIMANITAVSLGPLSIPPGNSNSFRQIVNIKVNAGNYVLVPNVYMSYDESMKVMEARSQLLTVVEIPISLFNPHLLFVELVLVAVASFTMYFFYPNFLKNYFKSTAPVKVSGARGTSSGYDPSWIPKTYLSGTKSSTKSNSQPNTHTKKPKSRKAD